MARLLVYVAANVLLVGCGGQKTAVESDVKGTVTIDGNPLDDGMIMFITPGIPGDRLDIKNGAFAGKAKVGEDRRVEVYSYKEGPPNKDPMTGEMVKTKINVVADSFNVKSQIKATITEDGDNSFHFKVTSQ